MLTTFMFFSWTFSRQYLKFIWHTILIFRRYFRRSSLSVFYKICVLKSSAKFLGKHICTYVFSRKLQTFWPENLNERQRQNWSKNFKNTFLQDTSWRMLLIFRKLDIQTFNSNQICSLDQNFWQAIYWWGET